MHAFCRGLLVLALASPAPARQATPGASDGFSTEQLEQLVAPIALYPDSLLTQVMMAATYPLEIVEAWRWLRKNPGLSGAALADALQEQVWDPSIKSLCGVPDVLERMDDNLDWARDLGDAFLGQQAQLMDAVQTMRRKAYEAGILESGAEQTVTQEAAGILVIEQTSTEVIYVPVYYPTEAYGDWYYDDWYYPALYVRRPAGRPVYGYGSVARWGGCCWGGCHWRRGHTEIHIDAHRYNTFVQNTEIDDRRKDVQNQVGSDGRWQHSAEHRMGVSYRDSHVAERYGAAAGETRIPRDQARGYGEHRTPRAPSRGGSPTDPGTREANRARTERPTSSRSTSGTTGRTTSGFSTRQSGGSLGGSRSPTLDNRSSQRGASSRGSSGARGASTRRRGGR